MYTMATKDLHFNSKKLFEFGLLETKSYYLHPRKNYHLYRTALSQKQLRAS